VAKISDEYLAFDGLLSGADFTYATDSSTSANRILEDIRSGMIDSLTSPIRFPPGEATLLDASFVQDPLVETLRSMPDDDPYNVAIDEIEELEPEMKSRLAELVGVERRKDALSLELYQLRAALELSEVEARMLRTKLIGKGPTLQVEAGEVPVVVPSVWGMAVEVAKQLLERNALIAGDEVVYQDSLEPADTVISQFPDQGKLAKRGDTVNLVVSSGPASVPNVIGMSAEEASEILEENSLRVLRTYCVTDEQPPDHVVASTPSAGTEVTRHSEVVLLIARKENEEDKS
jgi:hypothetical protein